MVKILQASLQQYVMENFQMYKPDEKAEELGIKLPTFVGSQKKQENSRKTYISASLTTPEPLSVWITANCGKFLKRWESQNTYMRAKKQQLELDVEQQTGSKLGEEYIKAVYY